MSNQCYCPRAREQGLLVEPLGDELLVFDSDRDRAHSLNTTAAKVWRACDGNRDIHALQVHCGLDEETLQLALERLRTSQLLDEPEGPLRVSRRVVLRRGVLAGAGLGVTVPVIRSITAPSAAMAASCKTIGEACTSATSCCPDLGCSGCGHSPVCCVQGGGACTSDGQCCDGACNSKGVCLGVPCFI